MQKFSVPCIKTGDFAKLCNTNKRTLIHYDEIGLFSPAYTDEKGYRYYSENQCDTFFTITCLKEIGMPLKEIKRFIIYRKALGAKAVCFNLLGNIVAFIPYGMLLPLLAHNQRKFYRVVLLSFDFSLLVELVQLVSKVGSFDVDDLILNTIGGAIGYVGFLLANHIRCHKFEQKE